MPETPAPSPLADLGLVWTCWEAPDGHVVVGDEQPPADSPFRWLHLDLWDQRSARWIAQRSVLPPEVLAVFMGEQADAAIAQNGALALTLPDFERDFDREDTGRIGTLHVALRPGLMLTGRNRPLHTPDIIRHRAAQAAAIDTAAALEIVLASIADTIARRTQQVAAEVLGLEDDLLADEQAPDTRTLVTMRRLAARLHRMAAGMRSTLGRLGAQPGIEPDVRAVISRMLQRAQGVEQDVIAAQGQLRLLRDELDLRAAQQTNENVYLLSVVTVLIMPATLVTGFFGMNTSGMPMTQGWHGTLIATIVGIGSSALTWWVLRRVGLVRR
ncbi:CorA family divalent cation transporter [Sphingomonas nostoxanthinifaciens]|uniref:CorA family divalent cation transporter n=1 Tax=Sphingomonas nostoxanthinifaciens TaxID=2872652 RepID=UPI001CC1F709|nr:CorA family divalent cation transporter [Sphingomonas nostoxanthinifaciens]UAK25178.1 magnesium transporter CorA [Sphingomonas nostoxanthinifaciens]